MKTFWMMEAPGGRYLGVQSIGMDPRFFWTTEFSKGLIFRSKDQAQNTMDAVRKLNLPIYAFALTLGDPMPVEHAWVDDNG